MEIKVYSKEAAKIITPTIKEEFIWISIRTIEEDPILNTPYNCKAKLDLYFYDTSNEGENSFDIALGEKVWKFLKSNPCDYLVINCEAGISRSAGMAIGIYESMFQKSCPLRDQKPLFNVMIKNIIQRTYKP